VRSKTWSGPDRHPRGPCRLRRRPCRNGRLWGIGRWCGRGPLAAIALLTLATSTSTSAAEQPTELRLNDIQVLGSHNSYKRAMAPERLIALREANPELAESLDYAHLPLREQLDLGLRKLEIDVFYDPGGRLFQRHESGVLGVSSFPVLHVQNLDDRSHCLNLLRCLGELAAWSEANPRHLPVFVSFNAKDDVIDRPGFLRPEPFGEDAWARLDHELKSVLGEALVMPGEVFDGQRLAWPALDAVRGRFLTILDEGGSKRRQYAARWRERAMFANLPEGAEGAAILVVNDPLAELVRIQRLVRAGFIVRTRADADTREARSGTVLRRDAALASGAHLVSTDYYLPADHFGTGYRVAMPGGGIARCNPVRLPEPCVLGAAGQE
jgi:hypothetical protein